MEAKIEELTMHASRLREVSPRNAEIARAAAARPEARENVPATEENLRKVDAAIKALEIYSENHPKTRFQYRTDVDTGRIQVTLVNYMTGEVVEEIPSKKLLQFSAQLEEMVGLVMEKHA